MFIWNLCFYSEGVFKCPEDQAPLDYAKVSVTFLISGILLPIFLIQDHLFSKSTLLGTRSDVHSIRLLQVM